MRILIIGGIGFVGFELIKLFSSYELLVFMCDLIKVV